MSPNLVIMDFSRIFLSPPDVGLDEERRASESIRSGWVAPIGPELDYFEKTLADMSERNFCVALSSGTAALHLGLLALGVTPGQYVLCSTLTFVATANAIRYTGALPVFIDSDGSSGNMSVTLLQKGIEELKRAGKEIGAVIPVDFLGSVAPYDEIVPLCHDFGIPVLADAAESLGSLRGGKPAGSFGSAAIFSFNGNKIATTSGGGAFLSDDGGLADRVRHLATQAREPARHYEHKDVGFNYRMSNVLASIGNAQLSRLDSMVASRRRIREKYRSLFQSVAGVRVLGNRDDEDNCWLTSLLVDSSVAGFSSTDLADFLEVRNIETRPLWKPMHLQPLFQSNEAFLDGTAEALFGEGLALPSGSSMNVEEWERLSGSVRDFLEIARRN